MAGDAAILQPDSTPAPGAANDEGALVPYLRAVRSHALFVALATLAVLAGALAYLVLGSPRYEATARMLVTPLPQDDPNFIGVQFIRDSGDPTHTIQTAAGIVDSPAAAALVARRIGRGWTKEKVQHAVTVKPQGESTILAVTARADQRGLAAQIANGFVRAVLDTRRSMLRSQVQARLRELAPGPGGGAPSADLAERINQLRAVRDGRDPTLSISETATPPSGRSGAPAWLIIALSLVAGLALGSGGAVAIAALDRRIRDESELRRLYPRPILARIPPVAELSAGPDGATLLAPPTSIAEAFRTLIAQLEQRPLPHRTIMVTSPSLGDGKTTSAVSLALALMRAGHAVTLMDLDFRKPGVAAALGMKQQRDPVPLLASGAKLSELLAPAPNLPSLRVLAAGPEQSGELLLDAVVRRLHEILAEARSLADYVVLDTPALGEVSDALRIAGDADDIVVVARPGHTNRTHLERMRDLLERAGYPPTGFLVIGESPDSSGGYNLDGFSSLGARLGLAAGPPRGR